MLSKNAVGKMDWFHSWNLDKTVHDKKSFAAKLFFVFAFAFYLYLANILRNTPDFSDETEKLIGGMMIENGQHLYKDVFAHHGPLSYMLSHLYYAVLPVKNIALYRFLPFLLSVFSILAIATSPALTQKYTRFIAAGFYALGLAATQTIYGLMIGSYQIYAGHLLVIMLAWLILPLLLAQKTSSTKAFISGAAFGLVFFAAYSFVIALGALGMAALVATYSVNAPHKKALRTTLLLSTAGALTAFFATMAWLYIHADIMGYLVHHFYFNQVVYSEYIAFNILKAAAFAIPVLGYINQVSMPSSWLSYFIVGSICAFCLLLIALEKAKRIRKTSFTLASALLVWIGIVYTDPRGAADFQLNTLAIVATGFAALIAAASLETRFSKAGFTLLLVMAVGYGAAQATVETNLYETTSTKYYKLKGVLAPSQSDDFTLLRSIVAPDETVQQFAYEPYFYIQIDRMPASGLYYYLPWIHKYESNPISGYSLDVCADMRNKKPKIISFSDQVIWTFPVESYLSCVQDLLKTDYLRSKQMPKIWVRADSATENQALLDTLIVPQDFDTTKYADPVRQKLEEAKISSHSLASEKNQCLASQLPEERILLATPCNKPQTASFYIKKTVLGDELIDKKSFSCLEVTDAKFELGASLRFWPCANQHNQKFNLIKSNNNSQIKIQTTRALDLCISLDSDDHPVLKSCDEATSWSFN